MQRLLSTLVILTAACGGPSSPPSTPSTGSTLEVRLVDAPPGDDVTGVVVTIDAIEAHVAGAGWVPIMTAVQTVDLLDLQNGVYAVLGTATLPAGRLTQVRLHVDDTGDNHVDTRDGASHPLTVPSGTQSGIKLRLGVELPPCSTGHITLDFDGKKSIWTHPKGAGAGDEWILRPVVRLAAVSATGGCDTPPADDGGAPPAPDPGAPPIVSGEPGCGGVTCAPGEVCYNGVCTADEVVMY